MKKKLMMLITVSMLATLLVACGGKSSEEVPTPTEAVEATVTPTPEPTATSTPTPEPTATSTPTPEPTATSTPTPTEIPKETDNYVKGSITEVGFESKWMNLRFTLQEDMRMLSQEELDVLMQQSADGLYGDEAESKLNYAKLTTVTEMMAKCDNGANVIVQVERLPVLYAGLTAEEYIAVVVNNVKNSNAGWNVQTDENFYYVEFGGEEYISLGVTIEYGNGLYTGQQYLARKIGTRMLSIIISYNNESVESAKRLLSAFGEYDSDPIYLPAVTPAPTKAPVGEPTSVPSSETDEFAEGVITDEGYENAWIGIRYVLPEGVVIVPEEHGDGTLMYAEWAEYGVPVVQIIAEKMDEPLTEEEFFGQLITTFEDNYSYDENLYETELGGQIFTYMSVAVEVDTGVYVYQDFCAQAREDYIIAIIFTYADGFETEISAMLNAIAPY